METMKKLQQVHDWLVANQPEGAVHPEDCPFCSGEFASLIEEESGVSDKTYTEEEAQDLVSAAVAEKESEIAILEAEVAASKAAQKKADDEEDKKDGGKDEDKEKTSLYSQVAELTMKLDAAVIDAEKAKTERDEITGWLQAESDRVVAEAEAATRRADRIAKVAEVIKFPEDHVEARADGWASQDEEQFEATLADYRVLAASKTDSGLPTFTAMQAARESDESTSVVGSALRDLIRGRQTGVDPRAIR